MDGADHLHVTRFLEGHIRRHAGRLRAKIEFATLGGRHDVVGNAVVVHEGERVTLLDGDALGGEHPALLMDHLVGPSAPADRPERMTRANRTVLCMGYPWIDRAGISAGGPAPRSD